MQRFKFDFLLQHSCLVMPMKQENRTGRDKQTHYYWQHISMEVLLFIFVYNKVGHRIPTVTATRHFLVIEESAVHS
jgi:hypothetical protein